MVHKIKYIGVDFGSSNTEIAGVDAEGNVFVIPYDNYNEGFDSVMSIDHLTNEKLFFREAKKNAKKTDDYLDRLKEELLGGCEEDSINHVKEFFEQIAARVRSNKSGSSFRRDSDTFDFSEIESICFGHPAYYTPHIQDRYCEQMVDILSKTFGVKKRNISYLPEPVLAGTAYQYITKPAAIQDGDVILVLDFGGHTMDLVLLQAKDMKNAKGETRRNLVQYAIPGSFYECVLMGKDITQKMCRYIYQSNLAPFDNNVEETKCKFFELYEKNGDQAVISAQLSYTGSGNRQKFQIMSKSVLEENESGDTVYIGVFKGPICISLNNTISQIVEVVSGYLADADIENLQIRHVLYTGGTSRIKVLRENVSEGLRNRWTSEQKFSEFVMDKKRSATGEVAVAYSAEKKHLSSANAVAVGAALAAAGLVCCGESSMDHKKTKRATDAEVLKLQGEKELLAKQVERMKKRNHVERVARRRSEMKLEKVRETAKGTPKLYEEIERIIQTVDAKK